MSITTTIFFLTFVAYAAAHMGLDPPEAVAGARTIVTLRIGHDCGDDTIGTSNFTIELPPGLPSVSVEELPHWRVLIHKTTLTSTSNPPISTVDSGVTEYVNSITWLGFLPDGFYQHFNIRIKMPETVGEVLWFKGYQDCHNQGTSIAWVAIPSAEDPAPRYPASSVTIIKEEEDTGH